MRKKAHISLIFKNLWRSKSHILFSSIGLIIGTSTLTFFIALSLGIKESVLNKIYPVNQIEFEPETLSILGLKKRVEIELNDETLKLIEKIKGVKKIYPKERSKIQARLWGGKEIFGYDIRVEAFFDGIPSSLLRDEIQTNEFSDFGEKISCLNENECIYGESCINGFCEKKCEGNKICGICKKDTDCNPGEVCRDIKCKNNNDCEGRECKEGFCEGIKICERLRCILSDKAFQFSEEEEKLKGEVLNDCINGKGICRKGGCPEGTYCAGDSILSRYGWCENPIPVVLSPFLFEVYNNVAATALGLQRISEKDLLLDFKFNILFGESYFIEDERIEKRVKKICKIVGFSNKAMEFGVTMPLEYVLRTNARFRGRESATQYSSVIIETKKNEDVPYVIERVKNFGFTLSSKSKEGKKAANILLILTLIFSAISIIILSISAVNITHTFLMVIYERKKEIGIFRAVGASMWDIRKIILGEAFILGFFGGLFGVLFSFGGSRVINIILKNYLQNIPFKPEDFFSYPLLLFSGGIFFAIAFALIGAILPANRAAKTEVARVLGED